jgi:hypothetical protein
MKEEEEENEGSKRGATRDVGGGRFKHRILLRE